MTFTFKQKKLLSDSTHKVLLIIIALKLLFKNETHLFYFFFLNHFENDFVGIKHTHETSRFI